MRDIIFIAIAGALGSLARYGASGLAYRVFGERFPYGTLVVNVAGCLLLGLLMQFGLASDLIPRAVRFAVAVGFLGALTTFSTFGFETIRLLEDGAVWFALLNIAANLLLGLVAVWLGMTTARLLMGGS